MISTKILLVTCDGCGNIDLFYGEPWFHGEAIGISKEKLKEYGWVICDRDEERNHVNPHRHFCPSCKEKSCCSVDGQYLLRSSQ